MTNLGISRGTRPTAARFDTVPLVWGITAFGAMMALYLAVLTLVSGWAFALSQLARDGYYVVALAAGFALQVGMFVRLRELVSGQAGGKTAIAASGTTSAAAMVSCCSHYLVNLVPIIGVAGVVTFVSQYQVQFFWVGLGLNAAALAFIGSRLYVAAKEHAECESEPMCFSPLP